MTLSPTALEEAAKAMHGAEPWSSFWKAVALPLSYTR